MKHRQTKATDIPPSVKQAVWERDKGRCVLCWSHEAMPNAHFIPRSQGGLGVERNIVTLCRGCHFRFDNTVDRAAIRDVLRDYLAGIYPDWNEQALYYRKFA